MNRRERVLRRYVLLLVAAYRRGDLDALQMMERTGAAWCRLGGTR